MAVYIGTEGNDTLIGGTGDDVLYGNGGDDSLNGGGDGLDTLYGGAGNDTLNNYGLAPFLYGDDGNDRIITRGARVEVISGGAGDDTLYGYAGDFSGANITGIEQLDLGGDNNAATFTLSQLSGVLRIGSDATGSTAGVRLSQGGTATLNVLNSVGQFVLFGSSQAESITINPSFSQGVRAYLSHGHDVFQSSVGNDSLYGEAGNDTLYGGDGNDLLDGGYGANSLSGGLGNDTLIAGGLDTVDAGDGNDVVVVNSFLPVFLEGGLGQDTLSFQNNFDISGASVTGFETLVLAAASPIASLTTAQLSQFSIVSGPNSSQSYASFVLTAGGTANVAVSRFLRALTVGGSSQDDILTFRPQLGTTMLHINGAGGNDSILAGSGADYLTGGTGNDTLTAGGGADVLDGGPGIDVLLGGSGNDTITCDEFDSAYGGAGSDLFETLGGRMTLVSGGDGVDILRCSSGDLTDTQILSVEKLVVGYGGYGVSLTTAQLGSFKQVTGDVAHIGVTLTAPGTAAVQVAPEVTDTFGVVGSGGGDKLTINADYLGRVFFQGWEGNDSMAAANGNDDLRGDTGKDTLVGMNGDDTLYGGEGHDRLIGGRGADQLFGDFGRDVFVFLAASDSTASGQDTIYGFEGAGPLAWDLIDLSAIDADVTTAADDAFTFNSVQKGGLYIIDNLDGTLEIRLNTDADATPEMRITISGLTFGSASLFTATDFIL